MSDVIYSRPIAPPIRTKDLPGMAQDAASCFNLHGVNWIQSLLAADGERLLCWYQAPDAESVRLALRQLGSDLNAAWPVNVQDEDIQEPSTIDTRIVIECSFDQRLDPDALAASLDSVADSLRRRGAQLVQAFSSTGGTRLVCIAEQADLQGAREAVEASGLKAEHLWAASRIVPSIVPQLVDHAPEN